MEIKKIVILFLIANIGLVKAQYTAIPDSSFEQVLINQGIDSDGIINGLVLTSDINAITNLNLDGDYTMLGIRDLTGIEDFTTLENLNCRYNYLTELHIENNVALKILNCSINTNLTNLDITQNINLEYLDCSLIGDNLTAITIDFSNNTKLEYLRAENSSLNNIDLTNNINLKTLKCSNDTYNDFGLENNIVNLDLSNNTKLEYLGCYNTNTETVILPNTNTLTYVDLYMQNLDALNVSQNPNLEHLDVHLNPNLSSLDVTSYPNLLFLDVNKCNLTSLDVSQNSLLEQLHIGYKWLNNVLIEPDFDNDIQNIDLSNNTALKTLNVRKINLNTLNLRHNPNLISLNAEKNNLSFLNLTSNTQLKYLWLNENPLYDLDLSYNINLNYFFCKNTMLNSLNLKNNNNSILNTVQITNNSNLNCIEVDDEMTANNNTGYYVNWQKDTNAIYSENCLSEGDRNELLLSLYPNPANNILFINNQSMATIEYVEIYNMLGEKVLTKNGNITQINIQNLAGSLYLILIKTNIDLVTFKIIKSP